MARSLDEMTYDELDELRMDLIEKRNAIVEELHEVTLAFHKSEAKLKAQMLVDDLSELQRIAVASVLNESSVGNAGAK